MAADRHRVLMTADTVGGVWQYALELSRALIARGDEVVLATMGGEPDAAQRAEAEAVAGLELHTSGYKLAWMCAPWEDVRRAGDWLLEIAERVQPTVVHLNDFGHGALPWRAPVLMTAHSCVLSWWQAVHGVAPPPAWQRYAAHVRAALHAAHCVVAPTKAMLDAIQLHYGPLPETAVIGNGRSLQATPAPAHERAPIVLAAGRIWDQAKNLSALAAVAPRLGLTVCIAGDERHPDGERVRLPDVRLLGKLSSAELAGWFARASIYALPARYEPFGLSPLEAALGGCALVLGDIDSLREVWGDAALFVPPDDHAALADALTRLGEDPALRQAFAARARLRAARYTPEAMAEAYRRRYDALCAAPTHCPPTLPTSQALAS